MSALFVLRFGTLVLRYLFAVSASLLLFYFPQISYAECGPSAIGTYRTIELDASKHSNFNGTEKSLGLRDKEVILTFDDGPIAGKTNRILDILKSNCVKATFFAVGKMARAYPDLTKRIVRDGHTLAHHTFSHNRLPKYSKANASKHIDNGIKLVQKAAYNYHSDEIVTPFFRFPYLAASKSTRKLIKERQLIAFGTNIDSLDWKKNSPQRIVKRVMSRLKRERKGIILMHDIHLRTAKMLPMLLKELMQNGYKIVHMVPGKDGGKFASSQVDKKAIEVVSVVTKGSSKDWSIRKTQAISDAFIFAFDDFEPKSVGFSSADNEIDLVQTNSIPAQPKNIKVKAPASIKQWALRSALNSF